MTFAVSQAFMTGSDSQAGDTESSKAPDLTCRLNSFPRSLNVHRGTFVSAAVTVYCCVFLVSYIRCISKYSIRCITKLMCSYLKIQTK